MSGRSGAARFCLGRPYDSSLLLLLPASRCREALTTFLTSGQRWCSGASNRETFVNSDPGAGWRAAGWID
eukprot:5796364-Alexandrium_andersonii.AAC.1